MAGMFRILNQRRVAAKATNLQLILPQAGFPVINLSVPVLPRTGEWISVDGVEFRIGEIIHTDGVMHAEVVEEYPHNHKFNSFTPSV